MLNIIVGNNATGKTKVLDGIMARCEGTYLSNRSSISRAELYKVAKDRVDIIEDVCPEYEFLVSEYRLINIRGDISEYFYDDLNYLCRDVENVYLDEPEFMLGRVECQSLYKVLEALSIKTNIWITTHEESLCEGSLYETVKRFYVRKVGNEFELVEMGRGEDYEDLS